MQLYRTIWAFSALSLVGLGLAAPTPALLDEDTPEGAGCQNYGTSYAIFSNNQGGNNDATYSSFDPSVYSSQSPMRRGRTKVLGGFTTNGNDPADMYGAKPFPSQMFAMSQVGYIRAPSTGVYTATINNNVDDIAFIWWGTKAYSGFTRSNADAQLSYYSNSQGAQTASVTMQKGQYYPFRFIYGQGAGPGAFDATITGPNGQVLLGPSTTKTPHVFRQSCDRTTAPPFPNWP